MGANAKVIVFDLDDTLINEIDFLESAYFEISQLLFPKNPDKLYQAMLESWKLGNNVFVQLTNQFDNITLRDLIEIYRNHIPKIVSREGVIDLLEFLKLKGVFLGLVTDGRSISQRNKLKSAGLSNFFDKIVISEEFGSEKPNIANFTTFHQMNNYEYFYIGDNTKKDFVSPNLLGWKTICVKDSGRNIHKQNFNLPEDYLPKYYVNDFYELQVLIQSLIR